MPAMMEIAVTPVGKDTASLGDTTVEVLKVLENRDCKYELNPMGTTVEGDLDTLMDVARAMHEVCFGLGYPRVFTTIKIDDRRDKDLTMDYKTQSVKEKLARAGGA